MNIIINGTKYYENCFKDESELESTVISEAKNIFGQKTVYINTKKKIETESLGGSIPDGFLFDFNIEGQPEFYLVEIELKSHDYFHHIHPQITKFSAFFSHPYRRMELVNKIHQIIIDDKILCDEFKIFSGGKEIYKSILDIINRSKNILVIIDGMTRENYEAISNDRDTAAGITKYLLFKRLTAGNDVIYTIYTYDDDFGHIGSRSPMVYSGTDNNSIIKPTETLSDKQRDTTKYIYKGVLYHKNRLVLAVVFDYLIEHSSTTYDALKKVFPDSLQGSPNGVFVRYEKAVEIWKRTGHARHFIRENNILKTSDNVSIAICTQWGIHNLNRFLEAARSLGYVIKESH